MKKDILILAIGIVLFAVMVNAETIDLNCPDGSYVAGITFAF